VSYGATTMKCDVREDIKAEICALAKKNNIEKVILFGSRARGDNGTAISTLQLLLKTLSTNIMTRLTI